MTDNNNIGKPTKAPHLRLVVNEAYVDPVEEEATRYATFLETEYASRANKIGMPNFTTSIDVVDYPLDNVVDRIVAILDKRGWTVEPVDFTCSGGRAGAFWLTPRDVHRKF
jgi:hypothetical protein